MSVRVRVGVVTALAVLALAVLALAVLALAGCTGGSGGGRGSVTVDEKDNGHTVAVAPGTTLDVVLHSTYWRFAPLADTGVLRQQGAPSVAASRPGQGCVPGGGCGTVSATFTAVGTGVADVQASRTSCGEARGCTPDQASFTVRIVVGGATATDAPANSTPPSSAPAAPSPTGSAVVSTVTATEADNGRTITLAVGDHLVVRLASTYWRFASTNAAALSSVGPPAVAASAPGVGCVAGGGCGTVTARYLAVGPGETVVAADRTSCGEARGCTGADGTYRLHVLVR